MRPPAHEQEPLRTPLNRIFRSEGNVRVLRVLAFAEEPIARTTVARRADLNPSGVRRNLDRLADLGIVEAIGSGRNQSVRMRDAHPLSDAIRSLFRSERKTYERFLEAVRGAFRRPDFPARSVWLESLDARSPGTVHVGVLASPAGADEAVTAVRSALDDLAQHLATHFVVHGYTDADRLALTDEEQERLESVTLLFGWLPQEWRRQEGGPVESHRLLDERARRLADRIAELLPNDPSLMRRTIDWIDGRLEEASQQEAHDLREWRRVLGELSIQQVQALLREDSERAARLRQSLPFVRTLTPSERRKVLERSNS